LNEHAWGCKTLKGSATLAKNIDYFKKKGKKLKSFELPPHLSLKTFCTISFLVRNLKNKIPPRYIYSKPYQKKS
jgi:hypothetical protein